MMLVFPLSLGPMSTWNGVSSNVTSTPLVVPHPKLFDHRPAPVWLPQPLYRPAFTSSPSASTRFRMAR